MTAVPDPFAELYARRQRRASPLAAKKLEDHQVPPPGQWYGWLLLGGRGSGKTHACAQYVIDHVHGPPCLPGPTPHWIGIIAPTKGDAATSCFSGPSGIGPNDPTAQMITSKGGTEVRWANGSVAKLFGTESPADIDRLRSGGNRCLYWLEEVAAWRYLDDGFDHMSFGLRIGPWPRWVGSTTPKPRKLIKEIAGQLMAGVVTTHATMWDNPHLADHLRQKWQERYGGRQIGRQELYGEILDEVEGALWTRAMLDAYRIMGEPPELSKITVGVDPSGGAGEQGIVVTGKTRWGAPPMREGPGTTEVLEGVAGLAGQWNGKPPSPLAAMHGFVLADRTCNLSPAGWGKRAVKAAIEFDADDIVVETNYGGDMALGVLTGACEAEGVAIPVRKITASRGKVARAEPVAALTERGRFHMVGNHAELETQMCTWTDDLDWSPDRMDAMVWTGWQLKLVSLTAHGRGSFGGKSMSGTSVIGPR